MTDLFEQVFKHIEGNDETVTQSWQTVEGTRPVEVPKYGPALWIEDVHQKHRMAAIDCLALILFVLDDFVAKEQARRIVEGWAAELRKAVSTDEIQARDPITLLALERLPDGWEWVLSMADADKFIAARGMEWRFGEIVLHLFKQYEQHIQKTRFPPFMWEVEQNEPAQDTATPAPVGAISASGGVMPAAAPTWSLRTSIERTPGYRWPLYQFLKDAYVTGKPCPKAQDVLDAWKLNPPFGLKVIKSGRRDALEYELIYGGKKTVDAKAIQASISGLTVKMPTE